MIDTSSSANDVRIKQPGKSLEFPAVFAGYGAAFTRPTWDRLPTEVQAAVVSRVGSPVADSPELTKVGLTRRFAGTYTAKGTQPIFLTIAAESDGAAYRSLLRESKVLAWLPRGLAVPRLKWTHTLIAGGQRWHIRATEALDLTRFGPPQTADDLCATHDALIEFGERVPVLPPTLQPRRLANFEETAPGEPGWFERLSRGEVRVPPSLPAWTAQRAAEMAALVASARTLPGRCTVHAAIRPDRLATQADGSLRILGWSRAGLGPAWTDWLMVLMWSRAFDLDVEGFLADSTLTRDVQPKDIDAMLAIIAARTIRSATRSDREGFTLVHRNANEQAAAFALSWLGERRGWGSASLPTLDAGGILH